MKDNNDKGVLEMRNNTREKIDVHSVQAEQIEDFESGMKNEKEDNKIKNIIKNNISEQNDKFFVRRENVGEQIQKDKKTKATQQGDFLHAVITPSHYQGEGMQVFDVLKAFLPKQLVTGFYVGNVIKYVLRYPKKNGLEDLQKARVYLDRLIKEIENE